mgnify:CR=1 FL=1
MSAPAPGFRLGISRDVLDARGEPSFGRRALDVLAEHPAIEWEYIPEDLAEVTPEVAARYDGRTDIPTPTEV